MRKKVDLNFQLNANNDGSGPRLSIAVLPSAAFLLILRASNDSWPSSNSICYPPFWRGHLEIKTRRVIIIPSKWLDYRWAKTHALTHSPKDNVAFINWFSSHVMADWLTWWDMYLLTKNKWSHWKNGGKSVSVNSDSSQQQQPHLRSTYSNLLW